MKTKNIKIFDGNSWIVYKLSDTIVDINIKNGEGTGSVKQTGIKDKVTVPSDLLQMIGLESIEENYVSSVGGVAFGTNHTVDGTVGGFTSGVNNTISNILGTAFGAGLQVTGMNGFAQGHGSLFDVNSFTDSGKKADAQLFIDNLKNAGQMSVSDTKYPMGKVTAEHAAAFGSSNAVGDKSFAAGHSVAIGSLSVALGNQNITEGACSFAAGMNNYVIGYGSGAIGTGNIVSRGTSFVVGYKNKTSASNQFVTGIFNEDNADALLIVGNGGNKRSNAFEVLKDGRAKVYKKPEADEDVVRLAELKPLLKLIDGLTNEQIIALNKFAKSLTVEE